ncbi:MAG: CxxC-x17-CxxC domain-containing protein [archaeon]
MGNFRSDNRARGPSRDRGRSRDSGFGGRGGGKTGGTGGFRDRDSGSFERRRPEMHEVTCDKCGKQCEVPFKPTIGKPVFCSDCFKKEGGSGSGSRSNFDSRNKNTDTQSGMSSEQFKQINAKLDKIIEFLDNIEFEDDLDENEADEDDSDEEKEDDSDDSK